MIIPPPALVRFRLAAFLVCALTTSPMRATAADQTATPATTARDSGPVIPAGSPRAATIEKQKFHLGPWETEIGYAQAVRVGNTLYVSGSTGRGDMPGAIKHAYETLSRTLVAHGLGFGHVVKETVFTTDIEALKTHKALRNEYYAGDFPAATWVQVARLFQPEIVLEVEVTAIFPDEKNTAK